VDYGTNNFVSYTANENTSIEDVMPPANLDSQSLIFS
jgi:hypothetical protein